MKEVTDPVLLDQLEGPKEVTDPELLRRLEGRSEDPKQEAKAPEPVKRKRLASEAMPGVGGLEAGLHMLTSGITGPLSGLIGAAALPFGPDTAAKAVEKVQSLSYPPQTEEGKATTRIIGYPFEKYGEATQAGKDLLERKGMSDQAATQWKIGADFVPDLAASLLGLKAAGKVGTAGKAVDVKDLNLARDTFESKTGNKWAELPVDAKRTMVAMAQKDPSAFTGLDASAFRRFERAEQLKEPVRLTKGQMERDFGQMKEEMNVRGRKGGGLLEEQSQEANAALMKNLNILRDRTRAKFTEAPSKGGEAVQTALRKKEALYDQASTKAYKDAERAGEAMAPHNVEPIYDFIRDQPEAARLGWALNKMSKLKGLAREEGETGPQLIVADHLGQILPQKTAEAMRKKTKDMPLSSIEDLRKEATRRSVESSDGTDRYVARQLRDKIDEVLDSSGSNVYKSARKVYRVNSLKFEEQGAIERLTSQKSQYELDRKVALDDTWDKVVRRGNVEDIKRVKRELMTGGSSETRTMGRKAWREMQGSTVNHLIEKARGPDDKFNRPTLDYNKLNSAINSIGWENIQETLGPRSTKELRNVLKTAKDVQQLPDKTGVYDPEGYFRRRAYERLVTWGSHFLSAKFPPAGALVRPLEERLSGASTAREQTLPREPKAKRLDTSLSQRLAPLAGPMVGGSLVDQQ